MLVSNRAGPARSAGLSLVEVLVAAAVAGTLVGLLVPAVQRARGASERAGCQGRAGQLALAVQHYAATHHRLPRGHEHARDPAKMPTDRQSGIAWTTRVLPFLEHAELGRRAEFASQLDPRGTSAEHEALRQVWVPVMACPAESRRTANHPTGAGAALGSYRGVTGTTYASDDGCFGTDLTVRPTDITDGTSNTLLIGERPPGPGGGNGGWYAGWGVSRAPFAQLQPAGANAWLPANYGCVPVTPAFRPGSVENGCDVNHFWSVHPGGATFATADGAVRFLRYDADPILPALGTRAGGEAVSPPN